MEGRKQENSIPKLAKRCINSLYGTYQNKIKARVHIEYGDKLDREYPNYDRDRGAI